MSFYQKTDRDKAKKRFGYLSDFTPTGQQVLKKRFLKKDYQGKIIEQPLDMFKRTAEFIAANESKYGLKPNEIVKIKQKFLDMMVKLEFLSGMTLKNAGHQIPQFSACYVLPIEDSMDSIYTTLKNAAFLHKTGAGIGYDFSPLRPEGSLVKSTKGKSSGPLSFMRLFEFSSETVVNKAAKRKAGNMGILRIDHPDIEKFIIAKQDNNKLNNFNISVALTDKFMQSVRNNDLFELVEPHTKKVSRKVKARYLFDMIAYQSWLSAEPGILFIDQINKYNPTPCAGEITATNLCGEQPLLPYEACNLGSINLVKMLVNDKNGNFNIDWTKLEDIVRTATRFLDNVVDLSYYVLPQIKDINLANRKIGIGIMGFADTLIYLKIPYDSDDAVKKIEQIMKFISEVSHSESIELAKQRGSFLNFKNSIWDQKGFCAIRNASTTTIAPTGTTSIIANSSSGIEPLFGLVYIRKNFLDIGKDEFLEIHPYFEKVLKKNWFYSHDLIKQIAKRGSIKNLNRIPKELQDIFIVSHDIDPAWHVKIQAAAQKFTDNAVSKTVNMPNTATKEDVKKVFLLAYELGCRGVTVYRDRSRSSQVLNFSN
jgi:ribonucleoside-diphosphate reductase alpha chain